MSYDLNGTPFQKLCPSPLLNLTFSLTCRRRRRFDPSIRCEYPADVGHLSESDTASSALVTRDIQVTSNAATDPTLSLAMWSDANINDRFLLNHVATICIDLEDFGGHLWTFDLVILVEFVLLKSLLFEDVVANRYRAYHRSAHFPFINHSLCGLAANHLSLLSKSISMVGWEYYHRGRAIRGLLTCLQSICDNRIAAEEIVAAIDAILITTCLLSWYAVERRVAYHMPMCTSPQLTTF